MKASLRYLSHDDVLSLDITFDDALSVAEKALKEHARKAFEMPPKPGIHPLPGTFIHAMPAFLTDLKIAGIKWVSGFPGNPQRGLPIIVGLLILNDAETGLPLCIMDATWLTVIRTAAVSAIAAKHLSRENARFLGIIGAGRQGRHHAGMIKKTRPSIQEVLAFDVSSEQLNGFRDHVQNAYGLSARSTTSPEAVFDEADIVVTATGKQERPMVEPTWLRSGGLYIGLESFRYWGLEALMSADKFVTDDRNQAERFAENTKHMTTFPTLHAELGEILIGSKSGRQAEGERIVCIFPGMALIDVAFGTFIYQSACERAVGIELDL